MRPITTTERDIVAALIYSIAVRPVGPLDPATLSYPVDHLARRWEALGNSRAVRTALGLTGVGRTLGPSQFAQAVREAGAFDGHLGTMIDRVTAATGHSASYLRSLADECGFECEAPADPIDFLCHGEALTAPLTGHLAAFAATHLVFETDAAVPASKLWAAYRAFTASIEIGPDERHKRSDLFDALDNSTSATKRKSGGASYFRGLRLT